MVYDQARGVVLMFGGRRNGTPKLNLNDTWQFDGTTWSQLQPATSPPPRGGHAMAYDPIRERVVMIGGDVVGAELADAWEWDGAESGAIDVSVGELSITGDAVENASLSVPQSHQG